MARFVANQGNPRSEGQLAAYKAPTVAWNTLDELRSFTSQAGCTQAQFDQAIETVGNNPLHVANYLQRYALTSSTKRT